MPTEQQILSEEQVDDAMRVYERGDDLAASRIPALCQTVRALRELAYIPKILPNDEMITYRDQVERLLREKSDLKSRLSEVEKERDAMHAAIATALRA